jgi:large subunit ribosomal protein L3
MGSARVTVRGLKVVGLREEDNLILVKGAVPGRNGGYVMIKKA